jgi:hypothetical protein
VEPLPNGLKDEALPQQLDFWHENGFVVFRSLLPRDEIAALKQAAHQVFAGFYDTKRAPIEDPWGLRKDPAAVQIIDNPHWASRKLRQAASDQRIGFLASLLSNSRVIRLWSTQLISKPPSKSRQSVVGWHQDMAYWQCAEPTEMLSAWIALTNTDERNGCLQMISGSHKRGLVRTEGFFHSDATGTRAFEAKAFNEKRITLKMNAGDVSFHHCLTIHGSGLNRSSQTRLGFTVHLMPSTTRYVAGTSCDDHINVRLLNGGDGYPFSGRHFPATFVRGED